MLAVCDYDAKTTERNNPSNGFNDWTLGFESHNYTDHNPEQAHTMQAAS